MLFINPKWHDYYHELNNENMCLYSFNNFKILRISVLIEMVGL